MSTADPEPTGIVTDPHANPNDIAIDEFLHTPARLNICSLLAPADWSSSPSCATPSAPATRPCPSR